MVQKLANACKVSFFEANCWLSKVKNVFAIRLRSWQDWLGLLWLKIFEIVSQNLGMTSKFKSGLSKTLIQTIDSWRSWFLVLSIMSQSKAKTPGWRMIPKKIELHKRLFIFGALFTDFTWNQFWGFLKCKISYCNTFRGSEF